VKLPKYARTYIRDTHTRAQTQKKGKEKVEILERSGKKEGKSRKTLTQKKKEKGDRKERKKKGKKERTKGNEGKK